MRLSIGNPNLESILMTVHPSSVSLAVPVFGVLLEGLAPENKDALTASPQKDQGSNVESFSVLALESVARNRGRTRVLRLWVSPERRLRSAHTGQLSCNVHLPDQ